ncbi:hypothetical protein BDF22DRAFT_743868 [Syncephalis plumigaleata]|nr:hypothetical protein BDF22DRAFT_743868 [Syncephalis plumigaleata]
MNQRSIAARLVTQLLKLRYTHLIRQAWQAVRVDYVNHSSLDYASANNDALNNTRNHLLRYLMMVHEHFGDLVCTMVDTLPHDDPLSLAFFFHILELIALPSTDNAIQLSARLLHKTSNDYQGGLFRSKPRDRIRCNSAIVWMMLAQRLAGKVAVRIFTEDVHNQLVSQLENANSKHEQLVSLLALERFAITRECKLIITQGRAIPFLQNYLEGLPNISESNETASTSNKTKPLNDKLPKQGIGARSASILFSSYQHLARAT